MLISLTGHLANAFIPCPARCVCEDERVICTNSQFNVLPIMLNPWLKELYIANNQIKKMTPLNMVYMDLEVLDLSNNQIDNLEDNIFQGLSKIKVLKLSGNKISNLTRHSLKGLDTLEHLILSNNQIREISVHAFTHLKSLKRLDLSGNQIKHLDADVFSGQANLVDLDLSDNQLVFSNMSLDQNPIKSEYLVNLISLNLAGNQMNNLTALNSPFMKSEQSNDELDQQPAYLQLKSTSTVNSNDQAQYTIYPKFNAINRRPYAWNRRQLSNQQPVAERRTVYKKWGNLRELDLSNTQINLIESDVLGSLSQLHILKLRNNRLPEFTNTLFKDLIQLKSLDISNNPIEQLNKNLFISLQQLEMLNISDCAYLQNIHDQTFTGLTKLHRLDIAWCPKLKTVNPTMFQPLGNLKQLYLRGNSLETLDSNLLNYAVSLEILDVRNNQLYCDCSIKWLINVLYMYANQSSYNQQTFAAYAPFVEQQKVLRLELSQVNCAGPADLKDKLIYELTNDQLHCVDLRLFIFIFTGVFVAVVIVLLIVLVAWTCVRYNKCSVFRRLFNRANTANKQAFKTSTLTSTHPSTAQRTTLHKLLGTGNLYQTDKTFNVIGSKPEFTWLPNQTNNKSNTGRFPSTTINTTSNYGNCNSSLIFNGNNTSTICPSMITNNYFNGNTGHQRTVNNNESTIITNLNNGRHMTSTIHQTAPMVDNYDSYLHHNYATLYETLNPPEHYASSMSTTTTLSSSIANQSQNSTNNLVVTSNTLNNSSTVGNHLRNQSMRYQHPCVLQTWNPSFQNYSSNDK